MAGKRIIFIFFFLINFILEVRADTIYLKNGHTIEGLIKKENGESVELDVGFGTVKFEKQAIKSIYRSKPDGVALIRRQWQEKKRLDEEARRKKEFKPKEVEFSQTNKEIIVVDVLLNKKIKASLLLDTGATLVLLSSRIAKKLGIKSEETKKELIKVQMADGRKVDARYIVLDSVNVEDVEARGVGAVVLSGNEWAGSQFDGLLGMSFLNKFNYRIDTTNKKLILEKVELEP